MRSNLLLSSRLLIILIAASGLLSCSETKYFLLNKKHSSYKDYSDTEKEKYYQENKTVIDSVITLSSNQVFKDLISFSKERPANTRSSFVIINSHFFDTTTNSKNSLLIEYLQYHKEHADKLSEVVTKMITLSKKLQLSSSQNDYRRSVLVSNSSMYIPLKKISHDNYSGDDAYSFLIAFAPGKISVDSVRASYPVFFHSKVLTDNVLTNEITKK